MAGGKAMCGAVATFTPVAAVEGGWHMGWGGRGEGVVVGVGWSGCGRVAMQCVMQCQCCTSCRSGGGPVGYWGGVVAIFCKNIKSEYEKRTSNSKPSSVL